MLRVRGIPAYLRVGVIHRKGSTSVTLFNGSYVRDSINLAWHGWAMVMLLVLDGYVWGIICEECRRKYHHDKTLLMWSEYEEAMIRIGELP